MASFLSALGRARPVDDIQNFLGKQKQMAVQDLNMQNTKQQMDIQARKEKTEVDAIELEKAKRAKPFHLYSNPIYNSLPDAQKEYIEKTMLESGITNAMGVGTQGDALDFLQQIETTRVGFDNVLKPVVEAKQQEAQSLTNRIREEKLKPNPNLKIIEALTAQQQEAYAQWGQSVTSLSAHDKWLTEREKEQNAIKLRGIPQATEKDKQPSTADFERDFLDEAMKKYSATMSKADAMKKALSDFEAIKKEGKFEPKGTVVNVGDVAKKIQATEEAKDYAFWTGTKAREEALKIAKEDAGFSWEDLEPTAKTIAIKKTMDKKIKSVEPKAVFGEDNGVMGWYVPDENGNYTLIQRWDD